MGEDIRRRVVTSFRAAIDYEQNNNDIEAYRKYLDGVALVAAALQQDAECTWVIGNPNLSDKERKSLLGFAKQSVDRLIFLLEKPEPRNIFHGTTDVSLSSRDNTISSPVSNIFHDTKDVSLPSRINRISSPSNVPHSTSRNIINIPEGHNGFSQQNSFVEQKDEDISPIARMRKENHLLMTRYSARLQNATTKTQHHNLQLELQRRLTENCVIAQQQQEAWEQQRSKVAAWCLQRAEDKFRIKEKIECGTITEADFKKQRLFAAALQYEEEHLWLKQLKQDLLLSPKDEGKQRDIIVHTLNDKLHPFGSLMGQMQHTVLNKVFPLIRTLPEALNSINQCENINRRNPRNLASGRGEILEDVKQPENSSASHNITSEEAIAKEERKALQRHFHNIADDMKQDVKLLETLLCSLYELFMTAPSDNILTEVLHELYFPPIKQEIINLIRLGITDEEEKLAYRMSLQKENKELTDIDEELIKSCCHALYRLTCLGSPCQMLDSLTAILKTLAVSDDSHAKSIGADDLLPRLMTVVMSSGMPNLLSEAVYMENFMPVNRALGEAGYCLTVLQSVMTCIQIPTG